MLSSRSTIFIWDGPLVSHLSPVRVLYDFEDCDALALLSSSSAHSYASGRSKHLGECLHSDLLYEKTIRSFAQVLLPLPGKYVGEQKNANAHSSLHSLFLRHPSYTGAQIMICGEIILMLAGNIGQRFFDSASQPSWLLALYAVGPAALSSIVLVPRIAKEEKMLLEAFGEDYARYQREVPRKIFPGIF